MSDPDDVDESTPSRDPEGRPMQVTPAFFRETLSEHVERGEVQGGTCRILLADGDHRRFAIEADVGEGDERAYVARAMEDLIDLLDAREVLEEPIEARVPVDDAERVREEVETEGTVTIQFTDEGLRDLLVRFLAGLATERDGA